MNDTQRARLATYLQTVRRTRQDPDFRHAAGLPEHRPRTLVPLAPEDHTSWLFDRADEQDEPVVAVAERHGQLTAYVVFRITT